MTYDLAHSILDLLSQLNDRMINPRSWHICSSLNALFNLIQHRPFRYAYSTIDSAVRSDSRKFDILCSDKLVLFGSVYQMVRHF
jgi:hypothetical protein